MPIAIAMLVGGLLLLAFSADRFVLAAARLSRAWGLSPVLIGALVVGMGTSSPELLVSILSGIAGNLDLAIGNAVGSNVANVTLVLGAAALVRPVSGSMKILRREGIAMLVAVMAFAWMVWDLQLARTEGLILCGGMIVAALLIVRWAKDDGDFGDANESRIHNPVNVTREIGIGIVALLLTLLGAQLLVRGGTDLANLLGIGSAFVGLTLVAVGTSLPELATSIAAMRRKENEIVVGNVLGSNLFNALAVGGVASAIAPGPVDPSLRIGAAAMVLAASIAGLLALTGRKVVRWEGAVLLVGFVAFVVVTYDPALVGLGATILAR